MGPPVSGGVLINLLRGVRKDEHDADIRKVERERGRSRDPVGGDTGTLGECIAHEPVPPPETPDSTSITAHVIVHG